MSDNKNFKVGDRIDHSIYGLGVIESLEYNAIGSRVYYLVKLDNPYDDAVVKTCSETFMRPAPAPEFAKGDIVTWGVGNLGYEYIGEVNDYVVLRNPRGLGGFRSDSGYNPDVNAYVVPATDLNLRKVPPATRTLKVSVDILKEDGKMIAYSASSDEPGWDEPMSGMVKTHTFEIEVPA